MAEGERTESDSVSPNQQGSAQAPVNRETAEPNPPEISPEEKQRQQKEKHRRRCLRALKSLLFRILTLAIVLYVFLFHLVGITVMPNGDMYPRLDSGDLVLFYRLERKPKAQDVVVIDKALTEDYRAAEVQGDAKSAGQPDAANAAGLVRKVLDFLKVPDPSKPKTTRLVCRVVATPGDTVEVTEEQRLLINGNAVSERNIFYTTSAYVGYTEYPVTLGENEYFLLADYRNGGVDSRFFGPVTDEEIQGTVITILRRNNL